MESFGLPSFLYLFFICCCCCSRSHSDPPSSPPQGLFSSSFQRHRFPYFSHGARLFTLLHVSPSLSGRYSLENFPLFSLLRSKSNNCHSFRVSSPPLIGFLFAPKKNHLAHFFPYIGYFSVSGANFSLHFFCIQHATNAPSSTTNMGNHSPLLHPCERCRWLCKFLLLFCIEENNLNDNNYYLSPLGAQLQRALFC